MTPGTGAERQTPTRHDGAHAAQRRTHAGDMNVAPTLPAVPTRTDEKTTGHHDRTAAYPAVPPHTDEKTTGHHDRTVAYPVGAPFMTPGTEAVRHTPTRHDGAHAAQRRTHAGDMNVAPTLPAVPTRTDEKTNGSSQPHGGIPGRGAIYDARHRSGETNTDMPRRRTRNATTHARGRHECRPYAAGGSHTYG